MFNFSRLAFCIALCIPHDEFEFGDPLNGGDLS